jgi:uridine phosphorylase
LRNKRPHAPSVFSAASLLREARRQKGLSTEAVPPICVLDPDGDVVEALRRAGRTRRFEAWPCYHTELDNFALGGKTVGIVGRAVGAAFAVLIAEELFESGCRLLISLTSAGQIVPAGTPPHFVVIDRALRDEGTSYHYAAPASFADADPKLVDAAEKALKQAGLPAVVGGSWTTDAPFRETAEAVDAARREGLLTVEMEAAALYAFAQAKGHPVLCLAHVTNTMGRMEGDFEKGEAGGAAEALAVLEAIVSAAVGF